MSSITFLTMADENVVNLAYADLLIHALLLPPAIWIAWRHGKKGLLCWPIFLSYFILRYIADLYQIFNRDKPVQPSAVTIFTVGGSVQCLTLTLVGIIYEANIILPLPPRRMTEKIILGILHLVSTAGVGLAVYGGSPRRTGGVINSVANQIGNCVMAATLVALAVWMMFTYRRIRSFSDDPNSRPALTMFRAAVVAISFHFVRTAYNTTYAFAPIPSLDPVTGAFSNKLLIINGMQLAVTLTVMAGGWLGREPKPKEPPSPETPVEETGHNFLPARDPAYRL